MKKRKRKLEGKKEYEFYRWGTLSPKDHPEVSNYEERTFHTAPVRKGIYAFPKGYIETFLLGLSDERKNPDQNNNGRCFWLRDNSGKILTVDDVYVNPDFRAIIKPEIKKLLKLRKIKEKDLDYIFIGDKDNDDEWDIKDNHKMIYMTKVKRFKYSGPYIWHHLSSYFSGNIERPLVQEKDILDKRGSWIKTTMKIWEAALRKLDTIERWQSYIETWGSSTKYENGSSHGNPHTRPNIYSKDHYEVFIEKV